MTKNIIEQAKKNFALAAEAWQKQFKLSQKDMKFCSTDSQWPEEVKQARSGRPTYASDRINSQVKQIVNAQRENRPAVTVHAANNEGDQETAEVLQGMIRHIEYDSDADMAYDQAFEDAVRCGLGFWRIITEYEKDSFDQCIKVESIINPFSVYIDPNFKKLDGSDIRWAFIVDSLTEEEFKSEYPDADLTSMNDSAWYGLNQRMPTWFSNSGKICTVAEYFVKEEKEKTICKLADGRVVAKEELSDEEKGYIILERKCQEPVIKWYKMNGIEVLEETIWPGDRIPVIPVFGDALLEDGQRIYSGLVRKVMEEQMMLNIAKTTAIELIAATPKTPWIGPVGFVGDKKADWQDVNLKNLAYLEYEIVDDMGNPLPPPTRNVQEPPIQGVLELMNSIEMDIKSTNNMFDPSMGQKITNQSGVAVKALQNAGSIGNFHFSDNLSRAIRLEGRCFLDLIPKLYTEKRVAHVVGLDDKHKMITINGEGMEGEEGIEPDMDGLYKIFDVTTGRYNVTVSAGPSYQTKRQENLALLFDLAGKDPALMQVAGDIIVSQLDSPIALKLTDRLERALPPGLLEEDKTPLPPAVQKQLKDDQDMIEQLTMALKKETELADREQANIVAKREIAMIDQQTALMKQKAEYVHDTNLLLFKEELAELREKAKASHEVMVSVQQHILEKDQLETKAALKNQEHVIKGAVDQLATPEKEEKAEVE